MKSKTAVSAALIEVPVVGIGYSAGGLEAVQAILACLAPDTGLAIVIIPHLQEHQESHLVEILSKVTRLPVRAIETGMHIEPDTVFVLPPGHDVVLSGDFLNLNPRGESPVHHLGIDFFFASLSQSRKSKAMGIVLSGTGSDGTLGLKAIKTEGGITIVQDPKTAKFDGMPRSAIASGIADLILAPETIAAELERLAKHPYTKAALQPHIGSSWATGTEPPQLDETSVLKQILGLLLDHTKIDFSLYKPSTIKRRVERQMMLRKIETIEKYAEYLRKNSEEVTALYEDIFIHVTDFFRDPEIFEAVRQKVFPEVFKGKDEQASVRVWIPGCATGEEVYSLAILLLEYLEGRSLKVPISLFATDISEPALQRARKGVYADYQMRSVSSERLEKFFDEVNGGYKIKKHVRDLCIFSRHDVTSNPPIPRVDLISCRNVLIYFSTELQKRLFPVFHYALNPDGFLWLGRAENPDVASKLFEPVDKSHKIFAKARGTSMQQPRFSAPSYPMPREVTPKPAFPITGVSEAGRNADQVILYRYAPPSVVIDHGLNILQFRGRTVPYLEPSPGVASYNLLKMANPDLSAALRICVQMAKKQNVQARKEEIEFEFEGKVRKTNIDVSPLNPAAPPKDRQYLVIFEDATTTRAAKGKVKPLPKFARGKRGQNQIEALSQYNTQLQQELDAAREYQQSLIEEYESTQEELTSANEELRSTNEELQSTNEELHSTNEELGSAKEELQAANEELLSTNEEIQERNEALEKALAELARSEQRFRLMVQSVKDYAIFMLDTDGCVTTWNEGAQRLKGYDPREIIGSHFSRFYTAEDIARNHPQEELRLAFLNGKYEEEGWRIRKDGSRFWATVVITRINDQSGKHIGFAKVTRDLTALREAEREKIEQARKMAEAQEGERLLGQIFNESRSFMALTLGSEHVYERANQKYFEILGHDSSIMKMKVRDVLPEIQDQGFLTLLDEVYRSGKPYVGNEAPLILKGANGAERRLFVDFVYQPVRSAAGEIYGIVHQGYDVTELVLSRRAIENERDNFRNLFRQTPEMVCILKGPEHVFEFVNEAHVRALGFDATGKSVREAQPESVEVHGILDEVYRTGKTAQLHEIPITVTDRLRYFNLTYSARRDEWGKINGIMILGVEVTDQVLGRKEALKAIQTRDEFLSIASHELKTPLTSLQIQVQLRDRNVARRNSEAFTFENLHKMFESDRRQIDRLTRLIDDMLDATRISSNRLALRLERVDLYAVVMDVLERMSSQFAAAGAKILLEKEDHAEGFFDRFRIEQVFVNLLTNALRYGGGKPVHVRLSTEGRNATFMVRDEGMGIAKADHERIFRQFERATRTSVATGLGLGLYIAKQIVEGHDGAIRVESEPGQGAAFFVELPLKDEAR